MAGGNQEFDTAAVYPAASSAYGQLHDLSADRSAPTTFGEGSWIKKYVRTGITVEAYGIYRIDPILEVGAPSESVVVAAESPMLKTESTEVSYDIPTCSLDDLPILTLGGAPPVFSTVVVWETSGIRWLGLHSCPALILPLITPCALMACLPVRKPLT